MSDQWLKCLVTEGMFSDESVVQITTLADQQLSFFVPTSATRDNQLKVHVIERTKDGTLVVIPNENRSIVPVSSNKIVAA